MTCDQFEFLPGRGRQDVSSLPADARVHLQECPRCRNLRVLWSAPDRTPEIPAELQSRITARIVTGLRPVSPLPSDATLVLLFLSLMLAAVVAGALLLGVAGWKLMTFAQGGVILPLFLASALLIAWVVTSQMIPGAPRGVTPPAALLAVFFPMGAATLLLFPSVQIQHPMTAGLKCWELGLTVSAAAAVLFLLVLRRAAPLSPVRLGLAAGCLAGLAGWAVLELYCPVHDRGHIGLWHLGECLTATAIGGILGMISGYRNIRPSRGE